jgi:hypothetical protein
MREASALFDSEVHRVHAEETGRRWLLTSLVLRAPRGRQRGPSAPLEQEGANRDEHPSAPGERSRSFAPPTDDREGDGETRALRGHEEQWEDRKAEGRNADRVMRSSPMWAVIATAAPT